MGPDAAREMQDALKQGARLVAREAAANAPKGTKPIPKSRKPQQRLAAAYRGTTSGHKGIVRNPLPYARIWEYRKTGTTAQMRGVRPVGRAIEANQEEVVDALGDAIEEAARRNGWR